MKRNRLTGFAGALSLAFAACDSSTGAPTSPTGATPIASFAQIGASCAVDVGPTEYPLPAFHELEGWLEDAIDATGSSVSCGEVRSLDAKMEALAKALDRTPPNFDAACGLSGAIANEVAALAENDRLTLPTFPPPFPGGPTNVLTAARELNARWCAAARGELEGPRS